MPNYIAVAKYPGPISDPDRKDIKVSVYETDTSSLENAIDDPGSYKPGGAPLFEYWARSPDLEHGTDTVKKLLQVCYSIDVESNYFRARGLTPGMHFYLKSSKAIPNQENEDASSFGSQILQVESALRSLSKYLHGINDPEILSAEMRAARAYIGSLLCFLEESKSDEGIKEIPGELVRGLETQMQRTDWKGVSSEARGWIRLILDYIKLILALG